MWWFAETWRQAAARHGEVDVQEAQAEGESRVSSAAKREDGQ